MKWFAAIFGCFAVGLIASEQTVQIGLPQQSQSLPVVSPASSVNGAGVSSQPISIGTAPFPTSGAIRLTNNEFVKQLLTNGTTADVMGFDNSNNLQVGDSSGGRIDYFAGSHRFRVGATAVWDIDSSGNITDDGTHVITAGGVVAGSLFKTVTAEVNTGGGSATPSFTTSTIGGAGQPTLASQNGWIKAQDSNGNTVWIPVWK